MPQKAKPEERTILQALSELAGYEDIQTSEDLGKLSESKFMQRWGLPLITGAEMQTEDYDPGALDAAFASLGFVGGSLKTGFKLAKEGAKRVGRKIGLRHNWLYDTAREVAEGYQPGTYAQQLAESVEPLAYGDIFVTGENLGDAARRMEELGGYDVVQQRLRAAGVTGAELSESVSRLAEETVTPQQQTMSLFEDVVGDVEMAGPPLFEQVPGVAPAGTAQTVAKVVRSADEVAQSIVNEFGVSSNVSWNEAQSIVADVGEEGWTRFQSELNSLPIDQRELYLDNFLAKYRVGGQLSGQQAAAAYKSRRFTSKMPDEVMVIDQGRHGQLKYTATTHSKGNSHIDLKWSHPTNQFISADLSFNIASKVDDAGNAFEEISGIWFHADGRGKGYAGRLMMELLEKIPENAVISESSMSYDALYLLLRTAIKKNAKIVFHQTDPKWSFSTRSKQTSAASRLSPWSIKFNEAQKLYNSTGDPKHIDKAVDEIMDEMRGWISEYAKKHPGKVVGKPQVEAVKEVGKDYLSHAEAVHFQQKGYIEYNYISIHKMAGILAGAFGFKNREELMKFISYNPESTEAQVFDNEFSL